MSGVTVPTTMASMSVGETARSQRIPRRRGGQIAGGDALIDDVPLANAGARGDPLVGGVDHLFQSGVGEQAWRHVGAEGGDLYSKSYSRARGLAQSNGFSRISKLMNTNPLF